MALQKVEVEDFSGGITDYYLNAPINKLKACDNLLIIQYPGIGKPFTRPGCDLYASSAPQIPAGAQRISTAFIYKSIFHLQSSQKLYYFDGTNFQDVLGPTGNNAFTSASTSTYFTYANWNFHTLMAHSGRQHPQKIVLNASNVPEVFEAGLPRISSSGITITPAAGTNNWLYKFVYKQTYVSKDNITFLDRGSPSTSKAVTGDNPVSITNIPILSNGVTDNFRTSAVKVEIYRTVNNGTVFYYVGEVTNGTTSFSDTVADGALQNNELLYTEGGVAENDRPPKCKIVHIKQDTAYYANIETDDGEIIGYRLLQSKPGDIDSAPATFFLDFDDDIMGVSSKKEHTIVLLRNSAYRVDNEFDSLGRGGMVAERISDTAGCISPQSVVQSGDGVFWCGRDGVYFTDGYQVIKLNQDFDKTYRSFISTAGVIDEAKCLKIQGKYDNRKSRIWWTIAQNGSEVDSCYILDLNWGVRENATFTTASGGDSFAPTAIEFSDGQLIRCDSRGYVLMHSDTLHSDLKIDTGVTPADWHRQTIIYNLESIAYNFGTSFSRKYVTGVTVTCQGDTNLSLQLVSNNDDGANVKNLAPIRYRGAVLWGDPDVYWGDPGIEWGKTGLIAEKRRMPVSALRCNYKSIQFTNAKVAIVSSDLIGTTTVNATAKTATLDNLSTYDWPSNAVDYFIAFETDGYVKEFLITDRTDDVLTFEDSLDASTNAAGLKWVIRGYPKDEILDLLNYSVLYDTFGPTQHAFQDAESGEVDS